MADATSIEINVDTFSEGGSYFVRTEANARWVGVRGPFADLQTAQASKADQLAASRQTSAALENELRRAMSALAKPRTT
jgi:hypothetical protein